MNAWKLINKVLVKFGVKDPVKVQQAYNLTIDVREWLDQVKVEEAQELLEMELDLKVEELVKAIEPYEIKVPEFNTPERNQEANHTLAWMLMEEGVASLDDLEDVNCYVGED